MKRAQNPESRLTRREVLQRGLYGVAAAGLSGGLGLGGCLKKRNRPNPNIILITLDTTRADRLGCYGYHRETSPNLDHLASESVVYGRAIAPSSWTLPSHASLFTGKFTSSHGAQYDPEGPIRLSDAVGGPKSWPYRARGLAEDEPTLAMLLKDVGYVTGAVVGGPWLKGAFGLNKGFDSYDDSEISTINGRLAKQVTAGAVKMIERFSGQAFFLFLNYFDPHFPWFPPEGYATRFLPKDTGRKGRISSVAQTTEERTVEEKNALYDAEILYMDTYVGHLLRKLKAENLYENTWIIVTADHGELLGEHGQFGHGKYLYEEELHVPLFMKYPGGEEPARRTDSWVQLTDILPMVCERLAISVPHDIQGSPPPRINHPVIAETYPVPLMTQDGHWRAIYDGNYKFLWNSEGRNLLFNLKDDPSEMQNLREKDPGRAERMSARLDEYLAQLPQPRAAGPGKRLEKETEKALRSLGYL